MLFSTGDGQYIKKHTQVGPGLLRRRGRLGSGMHVHGQWHVRHSRAPRARPLLTSSGVGGGEDLSMPPPPPPTQRQPHTAYTLDSPGRCRLKRHRPCVWGATWYQAAATPRSSPCHGEASTLKSPHEHASHISESPSRPSATAAARGQAGAARAPLRQALRAAEEGSQGPPPLSRTPRTPAVQAPLSVAPKAP